MAKIDATNLITDIKELEHQISSNTVLVPLSSIEPDDTRLRDVDKEAPEYKSILHSITQHGIKESLLVRPDPEEDNNYIIINGMHRWTAIHEYLDMLNEENPGTVDVNTYMVPVSIETRELSANQILSLQVVLNEASKSTKIIELRNQMRRMMANDITLTKTEIANQLSLPLSRVSQILGLGNLNSEYDSLVTSGKIIAHNAFQLASLPKEEQENYVEMAQTMPAVDFMETVSNAKREINEAKRKTKPIGFQAQPQLVSKAQALQVLGQVQANVEKFPEESRTPDTEEPQFHLGMLYGIQLLLGLDEQTVNEKRARYEEQQAEKIRRKQEREDQKDRAKVSTSTANPFLPKGVTNHLKGIN